MLLWPDCIPCITDVALRAARRVIKNEGQVKKFISEVLKIKSLRGENWRITSPELIRDIWIKLHEVSGEDDPFKEMKVRQNQTALQSLPVVKEFISKSSDPVLEAMRLSILGNSADAMIDSDVLPIEEMLKKPQETEFNTKAAGMLKKKLKQSRRLLYFGDNCGEIVFDRLFIEIIREKYGLEVSFVTRTVPVLNDAILGDALSVGIDKVADVIENGIHEPLPGTILEKASLDLRALVEKSDLIISKGGGNYDSLTEEQGSLGGKISFLFQVKCHPIHSIHQLPLGGLEVYNLW